MKRGLLVVGCFFLITVKVFGQQFSQYNTGSLYESFENPSQRAFIPDTTKQFAFNFFIPNFNFNAFLSGNGQEALKTRLFNNYYNTANLLTGQNAHNRVNANLNAYSLMFKVFASENGDQEVGIAYSTKADARGIFTDESIALFNGYTNFPENTYDNIFNDSYHYQVYNQLSFTYREQVTRQFAFGVKLSYLSGIAYRQVNIDRSSVTFDKPADQATLTLGGTYRNNGTGTLSKYEKAGPAFKNPGAAITFSTSYVDESGFKWQGNIKDLGFIHWASNSVTNNFAGSQVIQNISGADREKAITNGLDQITNASEKKGSFNTNLNGLAELSINKAYWLNDEGTVKFSPTLIGSKELFYNGFTMALVTPLQFGKHTVSLTSTYNELKLFNMGFQYMKKSENSEFFIGSERVYGSGSLFKSLIHKGDNDNTQYKVNQGRSIGMDFYIGVSFKFGQLIERRLNSSSIPDGDKGFIGKIWENLFHKDKNY